MLQVFSIVLGLFVLLCLNLVWGCVILLPELIISQSPESVSVKLRNTIPDYDKAYKMHYLAHQIPPHQSRQKHS